MNLASESTVGDTSQELTQGDLTENRRQLHQKLGWCMIRMQQIEQGMKWLAARAGFQSPAGELTERLERHTARISKQTLGSVTEMVSIGLLKSFDWEPPSDDIDDPSQVMFSFGMSIGLEDEHLEIVRDRLKDLVVRRNLLVHGFILTFDIRTTEGCAAAVSYVDETTALADVVLAEIRAWSSSLLGHAQVAAQLHELYLRGVDHPADEDRQA